MGDVVDFVGSDQPGHPVSFIVEVIHGARIDFTVRTSRRRRHSPAVRDAGRCTSARSTSAGNDVKPDLGEGRSWVFGEAPVPVMKRPGERAGYGTQSAVTVRSVNSGGAASTLAINSWMAC
jgi:hypothetical protein